VKSLVTGAAGFVGRHLTRHLKDRGHVVSGLVHPSEYDEDLVLDGVTAIESADLLDEGALASVVARVEPDEIYHLAAFSNPESSLKNARRTLETNILGTQNLLEAARQDGRSPRILLVGSAQQYGNVAEDEQPISEERAQKPLTPYSVSKASQELLGQRYFLSEGLPVFWTRSFNHTGPGQADAYVCSSFARQVAEVERGERPPEIHVGNLAARRDFTDVRDVARAYRAILERGQPGRAYNVCRGEAVAIQEVLDTLIEHSSADVEVRVDPERYHALDAPLIFGDATRLREETGWAPEFSLKDTLLDLLNDWRDHNNR
jgi:GDP-4-dehydro-6-deoxy-D-mannose reductase